MFRTLLASAALCVLATAASAADMPNAKDWPAVEAAAKGQTVHWNAWGGDERINAYIAWCGDQVKDRYGVTVEQVKLSDTATAVAQVVAEKAAGRDSGGSVDMIWINGENFAAMKAQGLLMPSWAEDLPNWRYVDVAGKPAVRSDFTIPTDGMEAPWGMAQVVFYYDSAQLPNPPKSMRALLEWTKANPGRFAFPQPPDYMGSTFLKQVMMSVSGDSAVFGEPATDDSFAAATKTLWAYMDALTPNLWRGGKAYPQNSAAMRQLMADGEIDIALSFDPAEASSAIASGALPDTARTFVMEGGTIGNANFVAIPYNAKSQAGALVLANFLLSPEAQARKQDPEVWGGLTVLDVANLPAEDKALFDALPYGVATLSPAELGASLPEPHPSWMTRIETEWLKRYGAGQ